MGELSRISWLIESFQDNCLFGCSRKRPTFASSGARTRGVSLFFLFSAMSCFLLGAVAAPPVQNRTQASLQLPNLERKMRKWIVLINILLCEMNDLVVVVISLARFGFWGSTALSAALFCLNNGHGSRNELDTSVAAVGTSV